MPSKQHINSIEQYQRSKGWRKSNNAVKNSITTISGKMCFEYWQLLTIKDKKQAVNEFLKNWDLIKK